MYSKEIGLILLLAWAHELEVVNASAYEIGKLTGRVVKNAFTSCYHDPMSPSTKFAFHSTTHIFLVVLC